jgi:excinuclease ABC subunit A
MGPEAGANGGQVVAQETIPEIARNPASQIGPFLSRTADVHIRERVEPKQPFELGTIGLSTGAIHTAKPLEADIPKGRLPVVTGVSGSGKTTLILESLVPGLTAAVGKTKLPEHIRTVEAEGVRQVKLIHATPIGVNVRSTVATYAGVHDEPRKVFAWTPDAKRLGFKAGNFPYNSHREAPLFRMRRNGELSTWTCSSCLT